MADLLKLHRCVGIVGVLVRAALRRSVHAACAAHAAKPHVCAQRKRGASGIGNSLPLHGELAVCLLDFISCGFLAHAQHLHAAARSRAASDSGTAGAQAQAGRQAAATLAPHIARSQMRRGPAASRTGQANTQIGARAQQPRSSPSCPSPLTSPHNRPLEERSQPAWREPDGKDERKGILKVRLRVPARQSNPQRQRQAQ